MYSFNGVELSNETVLKTREHFRDICLGCIEEAQSGKVFVNNLESYVESNNKRAKEYMEGTHQITFTFLQRAYWIQTGESVPLISF